MVDILVQLFVFVNKNRGSLESGSGFCFSEEHAIVDAVSETSNLMTYFILFQLVFEGPVWSGSFPFLAQTGTATGS